MRKDLLAFARSLGASEDDAEDLAQDTMLRAHTRSSQFKGGTYKAWLFTILRNRYYELHRRVKLNVTYAHLIEHDDTCTVPYEETCQLSEVSAKFATLPVNQQVLLSDVMDGLEYEQIASKRRIPVGTVKSRLFRARRSLAQ